MDKSNYELDYFKFLNEKNKFACDKIDELNKIIKQIQKDNDHMKEHIHMLEDRTKMLADQVEDVTDIVNADNNKNCDNDKCEECNEKDDKHSDIFDFGKMGNIEIIPIQFGSPPPNVNKNNKNKKDDIVIKMSEGGMPKNPLEMLFGNLKNMIAPKKEVIDEPNSDDEYDPTQSIYEELKIDEDINNFIEITEKINSINDIISLGEKYKDEIELSKNISKLQKKKKLLDIKCDNGYYELNGKKYGINLETVVKLSKPLKTLLAMVGIKKVKNEIFEMIVYYLQGFEKNNKSMLHSVIDGPPGVGKTKFGKILAKIYCALGIIPSSRFKYVKATDLIGDHVGATKHMTQNVIDEADGGVLFIDEAYALSTSEKKDPYGKECINTLTFNLAENKKKLIVIIAGYAEELDKYVFSYNPGLSRRFPFRFKMEGYNAEELRDIFIDKLKRVNWKFDISLTTELITDFFKKNKDEFPNFGGDIENFFKSCQFTHSKRMIGKNPIYRMKLTIDDINCGFNKFKNNKRDSTSKLPYPHMYS